MRAASHVRFKEPVNLAIAAKLQEMADVLEQQNEDGFRRNAYVRAGDVVAKLDRSLTDIYRSEGLQGLIALPSVGAGIAGAIAEMLTTGRWSQLDRVRGELSPELAFQTLPGVGPGLAARLHNELHVDTLEELERAAWDGRVADLPGMGARRVAGLRAALNDRLSRRRMRAPEAPARRPEVALLLDIDRTYREKAEAGVLRRIAPKRFNPTGEAWLPVMHISRDGWKFTILYSNTQRAHALGRTSDWVVVYMLDEQDIESQCTIVTETHGELKGKRVVRGREDECAAYYSARAAR